MLFLECIVLLINSCKNCVSDVDLLCIIRARDSVRVELPDKVTMGFRYSSRVHQFVHADSLESVSLPEDIRQGAK